MNDSNELRLDGANHDSVLRIESIGAEVRIGVHLDVGAVGGRRAGGGAGEIPAGSTSGPREALRAGSLVAGRYELVRLIGQGSMGAVWLANHRTLDEAVALKLLSPSPEVNGIENASTSAARFRFEAQVAARLSRKTKHVVRVTDHGHDGALAFLVMERLEGQTLEKALVTRGPMTPLEVSAMVTQIARGLEAAHAEGVLHRDLKPANIFLTKGEDGALLVKILDFGIARREQAPGKDTRFATAQGLLFGTPGYMSPEQAGASPDLDSRADLWSLAAIAYEALTGELPVSGVNTDQMLANLRAGRIVPLRQRNAALPDACDRFFERAFAPNIDDRHATCAELALDLDRAARDVSRGLLVSTPGSTMRLPAPAAIMASGAPSRLSRALHAKKSWAVALAAAVLAVGLGWGAFAGSQHTASAARLDALASGDPSTAAPGAAPAAAEPLSVLDRAASMATVPALIPTPAESASASSPAPSRPSSSAVGNPTTAGGAGLGEFKTYF
jgi:eukaryotic-like serine/threonine-protein kinase